MYRWVDAVTVRAATHPGAVDLPAWPDLTSSSVDTVDQWRDWLDRVWSSEQVADAIAVASPVLARQVRKVCDGRCRDVRDMRRIVTSVARYMLRMTGRSTPFGLFAGVAAVRLGPEAMVRWGEQHQPVVRPDAAWLAAVVGDLEGCSELVRRLPVVANNLCITRGDRLIVPLQRNTGTYGDPSAAAGLVDVSVGHTRAVDSAVRHADAPIAVDDLAERLACEFPQASPVKIDGMLLDLIRSGVLVTGLRPPMTASDGLGHVLAQLDAAGADTMPQVSERVRGLREVRDGIACHNRATQSEDRRDQRHRLAEQLDRASGLTNQSVTVDLRLDIDLVIPESVARHAATAAAALTRLTPHPQGLPAWEDFHAAFLERYGAGALVPLKDLVHPDTGLGLPATYRGSDRTVSAAPFSDRDKRLLALAQKTIMRGGNEIALDDRMISELAGNVEMRHVPPHVEIFVQIHATSVLALQREEFELLVTGAARAAGATTGRFLYLLDSTSQSRFRAAFAGLSTARAQALPVQVSCPPMQADTENLARAPMILPGMISVAEFRDPDGCLIPLDDVVVGGDTDGLYLTSITKRQVIEPTVLNSVEFRYFSHPLARFLCEVSRARTAVYMPFSWGAASSLPFLPRLRYGRTVLMPARWNLSAADLPVRTASWSQWREGMEVWRRQFRAPGVVYLVEADNLLRLNLDEDMHLGLLRAHLDRHAHARLDEAPELGAYGWLGGHAHEVVVPLTTTAPAPPAPPGVRAAPLRVIGRGHGHIPGASTWLYAKLYGSGGHHAGLLTRVPDLLVRWDSPPAWWYVPYRDPEPHLRLRLHLPNAEGYGPAAHRLGAWAADLRRAGILGRLQLDTYYPETGRYGFEAAMTAAERAFAADSTVALAQLQMATQAAVPLEAITVAGLVDLTISFAGNPATGMRWLIDRLPRESAPVERALYDTATRLAVPHDGWAGLRATAGGESVLHAWQRRHAALTGYREQISTQRDALSVLPSLLHMHHVRMLGIDPERERVGRRLARACALRWEATTSGKTR